jgi:hypothetical protein
MLRKIGSLLFLLPLIVLSGELNFVASVNKTEVGIGEALLLTVSVEGEDIGQIPTPQLPDLPEFDIAGTSTSQSTNIQISGGKVIRRQLINFIYTLHPKQTGSVFIGSCKLEFQGETYQTQPIEVQVVKGTEPPGKPAPSTAPTPAEPGLAIDDNLKLVATAGPKTVYQGELVVVEYSLYTRLRLADINLSKAPSFSGFWVEPIFDAQRIEFQRKVIGGKVYDVSLLRKSALFPMTTGRLRITPMQLDVTVVQSRRDLFDFFGTTKVVNLTSDAIDIDVAPLPSEGKPEEFAGGVGQYSIDALLDRTSSEAAEPITLTVKITGAGNIELIEKPDLSSIPGVKVLEPEVRTSTSFSKGLMMGYKEFSFPLIPQTDGEHIVPSIKMAYFDPADEKYHVTATGQLRFTATRTAAAVEIAQTGQAKKIGADIAYIKKDAVRLRHQRTSAGVWIVFPYLMSLGLIALSLVYRRHQSRMLSDRAYARKLRSSKRVRQGLREARKYLKSNNEKAFHAALSKVLLGYIGDRYNLDVGSMTNDDIMAELKRRNIDAAAVDNLDELLVQCDMRFSPGMKCEAPQMLLKTVEELIRKL